ncbi:MAG TPA: hypothetical protein VJV22_14770 [Acidobacteriaceae bacterium]|nr:hypothetical protein [Acidobacteriaceae bacterium]
MAKTKQSIALTDKQRNFLAAEADRMGVTIAEMIRWIIDHYRSQKEQSK